MHLLCWMTSVSNCVGLRPRWCFWKKWPRLLTTLFYLQRMGTFCQSQLTVLRQGPGRFVTALTVLKRSWNQVAPSPPLPSQYTLHTREPCHDSSDLVFCADDKPFAKPNCVAPPKDNLHINWHVTTIIVSLVGLFLAGMKAVRVIPWPQSQSSPETLVFSTYPMMTHKRKILAVYIRTKPNLYHKLRASYPTFLRVNRRTEDTKLTRGNGGRA